MSYTLKYTGAEIDDILDRAVEGGEIDDELALKAPLASPALTGSPTAPTQPEEDNSTKIATTEYTDRAADAAGAAAEAAAKEYTDEATSALYITDTASGSIASFSDGADGIPMRSVKASIEPVQDLHGYDAPWPAGGGKNKLPLTVAGIKSANSVRTWSGNSTTFNGITYTILTNDSGAVTGIQANGTATANAPLYLWVPTVAAFKSQFSETSVRFNGGVAGGSATTYYMRIAQLSPYANIATVTGANDVVVNLSSISDSAGGVQVLVNVDNGTTVNNIVFHPMIRLASETDATFAPYSNECPISGWTGANVVRTGINVWDEEWELGSISSDTGQNTSATANIRSKNYSPCVPNTNLYFGGNSGQAFAGIRWYGADKAYLGFVSSGNANNRVVTVPANVYYFRLAFVTTYGATYKNDISINYPSSDHDYHAYAGQTLPVTWETQAGEVFGGTIDVVSGELAVTHKSRTLAATDSVTYSTTAKTGIFADTLKPASTSPSADMTGYISNIFKAHTNYLPVNMSNEFTVNGNGAIVIRKAGGFDSLDDVKAYVTDNTVQVCAPLATPQVYQLSAQQITSLLGANNVWSNTGDTEVTYVADPKLYIAKMLGGGTLTLESVSPLSVNRPVTISEEDLEQAGEVSEAVEAAAETALPAESGETDEEAQE